jgi:hypothetical protein
MHRRTKKRKTIRLPQIVALGLLILLAACETDVPYPDNPALELSGTWQCRETSDKYPPASYTVTITSASSSGEEIEISNFYQLGQSRKVRILIQGYYLSIPVQTVDGFSISGSGNVNGRFDQISLTYTVDDQSEINTVQNILTR